MRLLSLFSGIGAFEKALKNIGIPFELVGYCEIDKFASKAYSLIHGVPESMNLGDITKVDASALGKVDMITYGFPCQDISNAGKQKGFEDEDGNRTRSGLFFEALRIIEQTKPKIAVCENVKALTSKKFEDELAAVLRGLYNVGYNNYYRVLNAKDYGVPQNRERVFIISVRKDIDKGVHWPEPFPLELRLKDVLEDEVDEKYYLTKEQAKRLTGNAFYRESKEPQVMKIGNVNPSGKGQNGTVIDSEGLARTITTEKGEGQKILAKDPKCVEVDDTKRVIQIGNCCPTKTRANPNQGRIYDANGLAPTLNCMVGGNRQPFIPVGEATKKGYAEAVEGDSVNLQFPNSKTRRGRVGGADCPDITMHRYDGSCSE